MMTGSFRERSEDPHVRLRGQLLEGTSLLAMPAAVEPDGTPGITGADALAALNASGLFVAPLSAPLSNEAFIAFGSGLGTLLPETDPTVRPRTEHDVVLNLVTAHDASADASIQPFASNALTLHSESSGRAAEEQPRYIVLMCCDPGEDGAEMSTVLVSMAHVADRLAADTRERLTAVRYRQGSPPPILRADRGHPVFSFRDFQADTLEWAYDGADGDGPAVEAALRALLASMYDGGGAIGVAWRPGLLVCIDNRRFFHGRRAARRVGAARRRHLKRLRIR